MRCFSTGSASAITSSIEGARRPSSSAGHVPPASVPGSRAGSGPQAMCLVTSSASPTGTRGAHEVEDRLDNRLANRNAAHEALRGEQSRRRSSPGAASTPRCRWCRTRCAAPRRGRDSRRRFPSGSGRAGLRAAGRCLPARSGSASRAHGTAAAGHDADRRWSRDTPASPATAPTACAGSRG